MLNLKSTVFCTSRPVNGKNLTPPIMTFKHVQNVCKKMFVKIITTTAQTKIRVDNTSAYELGSLCI